MCHANGKNPAHAERNYGIDLLKIVSMIMVALLHVLGNGILSSSNIFSWHYELGYAIEILCFCAVNCYAIISGYLNYGAKFRYSRILQLYLQVLFYTCLITLGFYIAKPEVVTKTVVIRALFPFAFSDVYWYFTAYFCMFFFLPFLNRLIETLDRKSCDRLMITLAMIFSFAPVSFGVYLLHAEPLMWDHFLSDAFTWAVRYNAVVTCLIAIGAALAIWLAGSLVDHVRRLLSFNLRLILICHIMIHIVIHYFKCFREHPLCRKSSLGITPGCFYINSILIPFITKKLHLLQ